MANQEGTLTLIQLLIAAFGLTIQYIIHLLGGSDLAGFLIAMVFIWGGYFLRMTLENNDR